MRRMKLLGALCVAVATLAIGQASAAPLHLAFGVDGRDYDIGAGTGDNPLQNLIVLRDHHINHYHAYMGNHGTNPGGHIPTPVDVTPGGSNYGEVTLASMNVSPDTESVYQIPSSPLGDFHLEFVSTAPELGVALEHGGIVTPLLPGSSSHLSLADYQTLRFTLASGAPQGEYRADFRIVDENGNFYSSRSLFNGALTITSDFHVLVNAVPEPASLALVTLAASAAVLVRRKRSRA